MRIDKGDVLKLGNENILVIGYMRDGIMNYLEEHYSLNYHKIISNYLSNENNLLNYVCYYYLSDDTTEYMSTIHKSLIGKEKLIKKTKDKYTKKEVDNYIIKKRMLGLIGDYTEDDFISYAEYMTSLIEMKNTYYVNNEKYIKEVLDKERVTLKEYYKGKKKITKKLLKELNNHKRESYFITWDKNKMYLYNSDFYGNYFIGSTNKDNKERCFRLYLNSRLKKGTPKRVDEIEGKYYTFVR